MSSPHEIKYPWLYGGKSAPLSREYIDRLEKEHNDRIKMAMAKKKEEGRRKIEAIISKQAARAKSFF